MSTYLYTIEKLCSHYRSFVVDVDAFLKNINTPYYITFLKERQYEDR